MKSAKLVIIYGLILSLFAACSSEVIAPQAAPTADLTTRKGVIVKTGKVSGRQGETASGTVYVKKDEKGFYVEFAADFKVQDGPDLRVYLSAVEEGSGVATQAELAAFRGSGASIYDVLPSFVATETDLAKYSFVVIHCKKYSHTFGAAKLQ
jgi:lipopolysaccharide export LptBFGC system permease protein LptF